MSLNTRSSMKQPRFELQRNDTPAPSFRLLPWVVLVLFNIIEVVTTAGNAGAGLVLHTVALLLLMIYRTWLAKDNAGRDLALALLLLPLMRMLSLALPYNILPKDSWHFFASVPLLIASLFVLRHMSSDQDNINLNKNWVVLVLQFFVGAGGLALGMVVAQSISLVTSKDLSPINSPDVVDWLPAASGLMLSAIAEEMIFRNLIQGAAMAVMGRASALFTALLYTIMSIGNINLSGNFVVEFLFVFIIALLFGYIVNWSRTIAGASIAHGLLSITVFILVPMSARFPTSLIALNLSLAALASAVLGVIGIVVLALLERKE